MDEDDQIPGESVNTTGQVKQKRKPRTASSTRSQVVSFRLSARAQEQLEALADEVNLSESKYVERLIEKAIDDPDSYYLRVAAHHSLIASSAILSIASAVNPSLPSAIITELAPVLRNALGPLPQPPVLLEQDELVPDTAYRFLQALARLSRGPR